jgi:23S rRNA pseudouridine2605 synthase
MEHDEAARGERIAKVIARAGLCSRRDAERLIAEGRVTLSGKVLDSPAVTVPPEAEIAVDGTPLPAAAPARLWRYHKPAGLITAARDPQGRATIADRLPRNLPRAMPVGRLDLNSEGLLLLTNDGGLKRRLELPATGWTRRYRVRVFGRVEPEDLAPLAKGLRIKGVDYGPIRARLDSRRGANAWLTMALGEGKNREVRKVCEHLGLKVSRLIRVAYGPFQLGQLPAGAVEEVPDQVLAEQLGGKPRKRGAGFAKAKPRPRKPGHKKAGQRKAGHAHRRRQT